MVDALQLGAIDAYALALALALACGGLSMVDALTCGWTPTIDASLWVRHLPQVQASMSGV